MSRKEGEKHDVMYVCRNVCTVSTYMYQLMYIPRVLSESQSDSLVTQLNVKVRCIVLSKVRCS